MKYTAGPRNETYDEPFRNMTAYAALIEGYLRARAIIHNPQNGVITAEDAARFLTLAKIARTCNSNLPFHHDNYIDSAAYEAIAGECAAIERQPKN